MDVGNYIGAGDSTGLVVLTEIDPIDVQFTVPQDQAPDVLQKAAKATLAVAAMDRTRTKVLATGTFSTLDNQVDPTTGTVRAKARFSNASGALFPNQFVNARVTLDTLHNAVVVPLTAVRTGPDGDFVWGVSPQKTAVMRKVVRGETTATQVVILSGLQAGDRVVTEGGDRLTQGGKVMLSGQRPPAGRGGHRRGGAGGQAGQAGGQGGGQTGGPAPGAVSGGAPAGGG